MRTKGSHCWSDHEIDTLRRMKRKDAPTREIAHVLGKPEHSIYDFMFLYAEDYGIPIRRKPQVDIEQFNKDWHGPVPYLHWTITKPWRTAA